ncbi:MAG: hypothetical protein LQ352_008339 [Teloschistes flavicans]|nr:MAG: hypothetical protein LQ352_008339 [Teloschistes flavicans]
MNVQKEKAAPLKPLVVALSILHLDTDMSALPTDTGIDVSLSNSTSEAPTNFKVILQGSTGNSLILESFYEKYIAGKVIDGRAYPKASLEAVGISHVTFSTAFGTLKADTSTSFKVKGLCMVPICYQGYKFIQQCLIMEHIFGLQQFESKFPIVLGKDFLIEYNIRGTWTSGGYMFQLPELPAPIGDLIVYTDGCCLSNGQSLQRPARGGYGVHFPQLSRDWDLSSPLPTSEKHTNQRAELLAVIRALQLIRTRGISCRRILVSTDSEYVVKGLTEWIPNWRTNGYRTAQKKPVGNGDLFKILDDESSRSITSGVPVLLQHIPREASAVADGLAKAGAQRLPAQTSPNRSE